MSISLDILLLAVGWTHVLIAPYTKVEESFNLHATHDVLAYGVGPTGLYSFDHFVFPGAVPRTFIGSVLLAWLSAPVIHLASVVGLVSTKFDIQILVRLVLASLNGIGLCLLRRAVSRRFGRPTSLFFVFLTCSQFHLPFWMGRTLPNMFALFPVNMSTYFILNEAPNARPSEKSLRLAISLLTFTAVVFRAEVLLLLAPLVLQSLVLGYTPFAGVVKVGLITGLVSLVLTIVVDSYFWDIWPIWPEFAGIYFNVYQGKSSEWGTSPPHAYLTSHLPKLLLSSLPLSVLGCLLDTRIRTLLFPHLVFISLISCLAHKEWRFIVYVVPVFNIAAARAVRWMASRRKSSIHGRLLFLVATSTILLNLSVAILLTKASIANYPGGQALSLFNTKYTSRSNVRVHISNLAAQTGASLFLQTHAEPQFLYVPTPTNVNWAYNKTEYLTLRDLTTTTGVTHLISEVRPEDGDAREWRVVESVAGFVKWVVNTGALRGMYKGDHTSVGKAMEAFFKMEIEEKLWIVERTVGGGSIVDLAGTR